ncbi:MAG: putative membrane protein YccC, partial [Colwellia sp.]
LLLPSWEANNLKQVLLNALKMNQKYLLATQELYEDSSKYKHSYNLARKEAFLAVSNINAAFQRLTQDPKSKQKEFELIYEIVTLNQTMISAIASIGNFITHHKTTPASKEFNALIKKISNTLKISYQSIEGITNKEKVDEALIKNADEKLLGKYQQLSNLRDENIRQGNTALDTETLHGLQEAFLIANHMSWLKSLSENLKKASERYHVSIIEKE